MTKLSRFITDLFLRWQRPTVSLSLSLTLLCLHRNWKIRLKILQVQQVWLAESLVRKWRTAQVQITLIWV